LTQLSFGRAYKLASIITDGLWEAGAPASTIVPVGSLRRYEAETQNVSLLAVTSVDRIDDLLTLSCDLPFSDHILHRTEQSITVQTKLGTISIHAVNEEAKGSALIALTGSSKHLDLLSEVARSQNLLFENGSLTSRTGKQFFFHTETAFYERLGLLFIPPELREGKDEIRAAKINSLPKLLSHKQIRGDLHMHTTWSDGRNSIKEMVQASEALGYDYIAITDHSQSAGSNKKVALSDIPRQKDEIREVSAQHPNIQVLHGIEVEILSEGSLDFEDRVLASFDIVLASLHNDEGQSPQVLTERYLRAIDSPYVDIITHPANRTPGLSNGYTLDFDRIFTAAATTGTALEIDGAPSHLDLDGQLARRAAEAKAMIVVDSDCHRSDALHQQMQFGVGTARRGWLEPQHVLNTQRIEDIRRFVKKQRQRA